VAFPSPEVPPPLKVESSRVPDSLRARTIARLIAFGASARSFKSILRLRPFDGTTAEGRSNERYRRAALTTMVSMVARGLGIFTGLAWIRLSLSYLGNERYGLWMAIGSIVGWANLADLGLARGIQNHLSAANARNDRELAARYVSTGLFALSSLAIGLAMLSIPLFWFIPWADVLNVRDPGLVRETPWVIAAVLASFLVQFPLCIVPTIYAAYQRGYVEALFNIGGSLLSLGTLLVVTRLQVSLPWLVLATSAAGIFMLLVNFGSALRDMPWLRPRLGFVSLATLRALGRTSAALFFFQIGALLINETQSLIIARRLGLPQVAEWTVLMRVYILPPIFIQMVDAPLIPAFREAHVRGEHDWLRTAFWRVTKLRIAIGIVACFLYIAFGNFAAKIISGQDMTFSREVWASCGFLLLVSVWNQSFNDLLIAVDRLRLLVITVFINGLITPALGYVLAPSLGLFGLVLATPMFSLLVSAWLLPMACRDLVQHRHAAAA
jgi:O-antigen/teichoic acid export membrane protein